MIIITSKRAGFRRAGIAHPAAATEYPDGFFSEEQLAALRAEPMLQVLIGDESQAELTDKPVPAKDLIAIIKKASLEDLDRLAEGEERKSVLDAIAARRKELAG